MKNKKLYTVKYLYKNSGKLFLYIVYSVCEIISETILPIIDILLFPLLIKMLIDFGGSGNPVFYKKIVTYGCLIAILHFALKYFSALFKNLRKAKYADIDLHYKNELLNTSMHMNYMHTENPAILKALNLAKEGISSRYSSGIHGLTSNIIQVIRNISVLIFACTVIVIKAKIMILVIAAVSFADFLLQKKINKIEYDFYEKMSEVNRKFGYLTNGVSNYVRAKDIRLYNGQDLIYLTEKKYLAEQSEGLKLLERKIRTYKFLSALFACIQNLFCFGYGFYCLSKGLMQPDAFVQIINSSVAVTAAIIGSLKDITDFNLNCYYATDYVDFFELVKENKSSDCHNVDRVEKGDEEFNKDIVFKNVSFKYPGTDRLILDGLNLRIEYGKSLSIVGLNGQGKSTLVKLLCRFYEDYDGEILYGNRNIKDYSLKQWYKIVTSVFQDFSLLPYSIEENILADTDVRYNENQINKIIPHKFSMNTICTKLIDVNGVDLSGGESQKIAIGRMLNKNCPIMILDEPTASLDAKSESEIYDLFHELTENKTAIFISHRLASCKMCDRIVVIDSGKIIEEGTHSDLLFAGGLYSKLWNKQTSYYLEEN